MITFKISNLPIILNYVDFLYPSNVLRRSYFFFFIFKISNPSQFLISLFLYLESIGMLFGFFRTSKPSKFCLSTHNFKLVNYFYILRNFLAFKFRIYLAYILQISFVSLFLPSKLLILQILSTSEFRILRLQNYLNIFFTLQIKNLRL